MTRGAIALLAACVVLAHAVLPAVRASWNQLPEVLAGKYVVVQLENGTVIEGSWTVVTDRAFIFNIEKASGKDKQLKIKGLQIVSRSAVRKIQFRERRVRGRVIGTIAAFYGILAVAAAATQSSEALQGGWGIASIAGAVCGYQIGKSVDNSTRELIPEP